jgi:putative ABC transport system substrate-binding protein
MRRRDFIAGLSSAAAWPAVAWAQAPSVPVVGFLNSLSFATFPNRINGFRQGLAQTGFVEGRNVTIEFRFAEFRSAQLPAPAADLVDRKVSVIAGINSTEAALVAKAATSTIPIRNGLVATLNRPGGNVTGVSFLTNELGPKRLGLLREMLPNAGLIAVLVNPTNPNVESDAKELVAAAQSTGVTIDVLHATNEAEINAFFAALVQRRASAFLTVPDPLFATQRNQIVALASYFKIPAIYEVREYVEAGGLMSYASNTADGYRLAGIYAGRILNGEKPADLPVQQAGKFELVVNLKTASALGITIPPGILAVADEVIE